MKQITELNHTYTSCATTTGWTSSYLPTTAQKQKSEIISSVIDSVGLLLLGPAAGLIVVAPNGNL